MVFTVLLQCLRLWEIRGTWSFHKKSHSILAEWHPRGRFFEQFSWMYIGFWIYIPIYLWESKWHKNTTTHHRRSLISGEMHSRVKNNVLAPHHLYISVSSGAFMGFTSQRVARAAQCVHKNEAGILQNGNSPTHQNTRAQITRSVLQGVHESNFGRRKESSGSPSAHKSPKSQLASTRHHQTRREYKNKGL